MNPLQFLKKLVFFFTIVVFNVTGKPAGKVRAKVKDGEDDKSTPIAGKRRARDVKSNGKPVEQDKNEDEDEDEEDDSDVDLVKP